MNKERSLISKSLRKNRLKKNKNQGSERSLRSAPKISLFKMVARLQMRAFTELKASEIKLIAIFLSQAYRCHPLHHIPSQVITSHHILGILDCRFSQTVIKVARILTVASRARVSTDFGSPPMEKLA